ncbi:MAG: TonB-dependent receptor [Sandaracinaceae bacterium]|nr:TonB-dependent receptor [Sandaracinaceae bacterium]
MVTSAVPVARAQEGPVLTPPELVEGVRPEVEPGWLAPGERVEVVLLLRIGTDGRVEEAEVAGGAGEPFDAAALEAARALVFRPATRDGAPIVARIRFAIAFEGPAPPPEPPPPPRGGVLEGRVEGAGGAPIAGAAIVVTGDADPIDATSDAAGRFRLELPPGEYALEVDAPGHVARAETVEVIAGEAVTLTLGLEAVPAEVEDDGEELGVTAVIERPRREVTRRTLEGEILTQTAGTRGDALRVIELLPGVARPPFGSGQIVIRGAAPGDSEVFLNGVSVPLLYHFGGLTSFYNSRLLERVDFYPGNFSVRYGRRIGGVIEVEPRDPSSRDFRGVLDINLIDASLLIEIPIGDNAGIALAARRSYIDFFLNDVLPAGTLSLTAAPVYYDYQLVFAWRPTREDRLRLFVYGSSDEFRTAFDSDGFERPFSLDLATQFHRVQADWRHEYDDTLTQEITLAGGWTGLVIGVGDVFGLDAEFVPLTMRAEWRLKLHEDVQVRWGLDWTYTPTTLAFRAAGSPTQGEGAPSSGGTGARSAAAFEGAAYRPGLYLEYTLRPVRPLTLVLGARVDYYRDIGEWSFDPRASARLALDEQWTIKAGLGIFSQPPEFQQSAPGVGNPDLGVTTSVHASAGVELRLDQTWRFDVEGYYKHIFDRVTGTAGGVPPFYVNEGLGRIYGLELSARIQATPGFPLVGILSYTLSRSERLDRDGEWRLFDFDQTHILTTALVWRIGDGWEAGAAFRLISGNPYTAVVGSIYDVGADRYRPIYGPINGERNPFFTRLDLRIEKMFVIENVFRLAIYLDVQNVYNAENREAITYSYDYRSSADVLGLPILPSLGIRGEL